MKRKTDYPWSNVPKRVLKEMTRAAPGTEIAHIRDKLYRDEWQMDDWMNPLVSSPDDDEGARLRADHNASLTEMMCRWMHSEKRLVHVTQDAKESLYEALNEIKGIRWASMMVDCPPEETYKHGVMLVLREGAVVQGLAKNREDCLAKGWSHWPTCVAYIEPSSIHDKEGLLRGPLVSIWWRNYDEKAESFTRDYTDKNGAEYVMETMINPWGCYFHGRVDELWWRGQGVEYMERHPFPEANYPVFDVDDNDVGLISLPALHSALYGHPAGYTANRYFADLEEKHGPCYISSQWMALNDTYIQIPTLLFLQAGLVASGLTVEEALADIDNGQQLNSRIERDQAAQIPGFEKMTDECSAFFCDLDKWPCTQMISLACCALSAILTEDTVLLPPPKKRGKRQPSKAFVHGVPNVRNLVLSPDALGIVTKKRAYDDDDKSNGQTKKQGPRKPPTGDAPLQHIPGYAGTRWVLEKNIGANEDVIEDGQTSLGGKPLFRVGRPVSGGPGGEGYQRGEIFSPKQERLKTGIDDFDALTPVDSDGT